MNNISIHAPTKGATIPQKWYSMVFDISIHAPTKGATSRKCSLTIDKCYFNPRTHEGCDSPRTDYAPTSDISIHAPTKGATEGKTCCCWTCSISIHAPTKGATVLYFSRYNSPFHFNPRTHEGCDVKLVIASRRGRYFNPRTHEGCDNRELEDTLCDGRFQSTHPRRVRRQFHPTALIL